MTYVAKSQAGISIHTLHTEGDRRYRRPVTLGGIFQSTPSTRRVTEYLEDDMDFTFISIHTLHTEGDQQKQIKK